VITLVNWALTAALLAISIIIHEWAHVFAVRFMGAKIEKVGFFPLGMVAKARRLETLDGWERYVIFFAGPLANFALALWAFATSHISYFGISLLDDLAFYNLVLGIFNLTPVMPLDGGRIAWQFLGNRYGILRASRYITRMGIIIGYIFIFFGFVQMILFPYNITLLCAGVYIRRKNKAIAPELSLAFHIALDGKNSPNRARTLKIKELPSPADTEIKHAMERLANDYFITFLIDGSKDRKLREQALINHIHKNGIVGTIGEIKKVDGISNL